jgi:hypothetical protein
MANVNRAVGIRQRGGDECTFKIGHCKKFVFSSKFDFRGAKIVEKLKG